MKKILSLIILLISMTNMNSLYATKPPAAERDSVTKGLNGFAFDLYHLTREQDKNMVISPYSLSSLLGMLATGATGNTRGQFMQLLNLEETLDNTSIMTGLAQLNTSITTADSARNTLIANALWSAKNLGYKKSFLDLIQKNKFITFYTLDFAYHPETARDTINQWVEKHTQHHITNLLPKGSITPQTRLVLTNAIYFKGLWQLPFKPENTKQKAFTLLTGKTIQTAIMKQKDKFLYTENDALQMLQLRYAKSTLAMAVLLPKAAHRLEEIQNKLNASSFSQLLNSSREVTVDVSIPKFNIESLFSSLAQSLQRLGLTDAFSDKKANFPYITSDKLFISDIIQKAIIKIDETGTVAAAATGAIMTTTAYEPPVVFNANHPFLYIIFDTQSGVLLFMGQVVNPS